MLTVFVVCRLTCATCITNDRAPHSVELMRTKRSNNYLLVMLGKRSALLFNVGILNALIDWKCRH
jgi:hypothetical protein